MKKKNKDTKAPAAKKAAKGTQVQMSESMTIGVLLTLAGGYFDAYTYIARGGVFANAQTGNIVLMGIRFFEGDYLRVLSYFIPVLAFVLGVFTAEMIKRFDNKLPVHWRQAVIALEMAIVIIVALLPVSEENMYTYNMTANVLISFVCSLQVQSFRKIKGIVCATTMCTGNLRSGTDCLTQYQKTGERTMLMNGLKYYAINLAFIAGAVISAFVTKLTGGISVIFCLIPLITVFIIMFRKPLAL